MVDGIQQLDEISISCYLNRGPNFKYLKNDELLNAKNYLGNPISIEIHSSINGFYRYGSITFHDTIGFRETLPLTGNDILTVFYKNKHNVNDSLTGRLIHFNIFDMEEIQLRPASSKEERHTLKAIKMHIIEAPFYLFLNTSKIKKIYGTSSGTGNDKLLSISDIVEEIFRGIFNSNSELMEYFNFYFQTTKKISGQFCNPNWNHQKFIKYLLDYASDKNNRGNFKLFTTSDIQSGKINIVLRNPTHMYSLPFKGKIYEYFLSDESTLNNTDISNPLNQIANQKLNTIYYYKFLNYDLSAITSGFGGGTIYNYNYLNGNYSEICNTYTNINTKLPTTSNYLIWKDEISNWNNQVYYDGSMSEFLSTDYLKNKILDNHHQLRCIILTLINENIEIGDVILITFMSGMVSFTKGDSHLIDEQMSGYWIVEEINDIVHQGKGYRKYILMKDSYFNVYTPNDLDASKILPVNKSIASHDIIYDENGVKRFKTTYSDNYKIYSEDDKFSDNSNGGLVL
jgi:hypothetical protein